MKIINNHVSKWLNHSNSLYFVFESLAGCVCERKRYQTTSKLMPTSIPKSMNNQCRIYARKSDVRNAEHHQKWSPKWFPNLSVAMPETMQQIMPAKIASLRPERCKSCWHVGKTRASFRNADRQTSEILPRWEIQFENA